jgi:hypothetical protein
MEKLTAPNGTVFTPSSAERYLLTGEGRKPSSKRIKAAYWDLRSLGYTLCYG